MLTEKVDHFQPSERLVAGPDGCIARPAVSGALRCADGWLFRPSLISLSIYLSLSVYLSISLSIRSRPGDVCGAMPAPLGPDPVPVAPVAAAVPAVAAVAMPTPTDGLKSLPVAIFGAVLSRRWRRRRQATATTTAVWPCWCFHRGGHM